MLRSFFDTLLKRLRSPPGALLEGIFEKNVKFWLPTWPQVGPKTGLKTDKKSTKNGTYVKIPLGPHFGAVLGSILGGFGVDFGVDFGVVLKCSCCSRFFCFFFLLLVGSDFSFVFLWENVVEAMREAHGRRPHDMLKMASEAAGINRELLDYIPQLLFFQRASRSLLRQVYVGVFFGVFLGLVFRCKLRCRKNRFLGVPRASWCQHGRFWGPTWPPKGSQNRGFWGSKRVLNLR